ncbi:MAG TPA: flagellar basal body-associated FliL family protein [Symbiobacteriaceae bacterium]
MNRGLLIALVAAVLVLAVGVTALGVYVIWGPGVVGLGLSGDPAATAGASATENLYFFETDNFVTDLADKDKVRYVNVSVSLAMKDQAALEEAKQMEPQIRDVILGQLRQRTAAELAGAVGKDDLANGLQSALRGLLGDRLVKVYITDLVIQ